MPDKYTQLHRKIVEGLISCNEQEYIGALGIKSFCDIEYRMPYLATMVRMLASSIVKIVMDWEKHYDPDLLIAAKGGLALIEQFQKSHGEFPSVVDPLRAAISKEESRKK